MKRIHANIYADDAPEMRDFGLKSLISDEDLADIKRASKRKEWSITLFGIEITVRK